jgi:nitronate monooxygenase
VVGDERGVAPPPPSEDGREVIRANPIKTVLVAAAAGIQVGTAFAFCEESGVDEAAKRRILDAARAGAPRVRSSARASPTGFPFKMLALAGAVGDPRVVRERDCVCNGLLGTIGMGQVRGGGRVEPPLITSGDDVAGILRFVRPGATSYSARDVLDALLT